MRPASCKKVKEMERFVKEVKDTEGIKGNYYNSHLALLHTDLEADGSEYSEKSMA